MQVKFHLICVLNITHVHNSLGTADENSMTIPTILCASTFPLRHSNKMRKQQATRTRSERKRETLKTISLHICKTASRNMHSVIPGDS